MSLRDFMQQLQEEDKDVVYSKPPEESIQVIPPVIINQQAKMEEPIKVVPPNVDEKPNVIKFKLKKPEQEKPVVIIPPKKEVIKPIEEKESQKIKTPQQKENRTKINNINKEKVEQLFIQSETSENKKERWMLYYNKACESKKNSLLIQKMRRGRFRVKDDNEIVLEPGENENISKIPPDVEILADFITYKKTVGQILQQKWLKK